MKRQFINEAFRLQQIAGIKSINTLNEDTPGFNSFMDTVEDFFDEGTPEYDKLAAAVEQALENGDITPMPHEPSSYYSKSAIIGQPIRSVVIKQHHAHLCSNWACAHGSSHALICELQFCRAQHPQPPS